MVHFWYRLVAQFSLVFIEDKLGYFLRGYLIEGYLIEHFSKKPNPSSYVGSIVGRFCPIIDDRFTCSVVVKVNKTIIFL